MRLRLASLIFAFGLAALSAAGADTTAPLAARLAAQNALFEEQYQSDLRAHPERATAYGDYRYNDQLDDYSLAATAYDHATDEAFLVRLAAIPTTGFTEQDKLSHDLLARTLRQRIADYDFREYEMPVSQMSGPHVGLADLPLAVPLVLLWSGPGWRAGIALYATITVAAALLHLGIGLSLTGIVALGVLFEAAAVVEPLRRNPQPLVFGTII